MNGELRAAIKLTLMIAAFLFASQSCAQSLSLDANADLVSRYIWRGLNVNDQPNIQPAVTLSFSDFQLGLWGSYGLTHQNPSDQSYSFSQEIDTWLGYSYSFGSGLKIGAVITDYYYPNAGLKIGNFNNYDDVNGPGAHTIEAGLNLNGSESFPLSVSGYINVYNDAGHNIYVQADYEFNIQDAVLGFFIGAAGGSKENPDYYGTDKFNIINVGLKASKEIKITEDFSLPVSCSYILNPQAEISYLVFSVSI